MEIARCVTHVRVPMKKGFVVLETDGTISVNPEQLKKPKLRNGEAHHFLVQDEGRNTRKALKSRSRSW